MLSPSAHSITVSIVSHGQAALMRPLLEQLQMYSAGWIDKIVVTVNVPEPLPPTLDIPIVAVVNMRPRGFGANHNAAFRNCSTPWFLVLNPDIRIETDVLGALLAHAQDASGVLTPRIVEPGKRTPENHRALLTPCEIILRRRAGYRPPLRPAWVPGMFMLFRTDAFRQIAGFDARYFMYGEDFDICARLRLQGWNIDAVDDLQATHAAQRASRRRLRHMQWHVTSLLQVWTSGTFWKYRALHQATNTSDPPDEHNAPAPK